MLLLATKEALYSKTGAVRGFIRWGQLACEEFKANENGEATLYLAGKYNLSLRDAEAHVKHMEWRCDCQVDAAPLATVMKLAVRSGDLHSSRAGDPARLL